MVYVVITWQKKRGSAVHVTNFTKLYPNMTDILIKEYHLKPETKILIMFTKRVDLPRYKRYRLPFKKFYYGTVVDLQPFVREKLRKHLWGKRKKSGDANGIIAEKEK